MSAKMDYTGIEYEALDADGKPVKRNAKVIGELPHELVREACANAANGIGQRLGITPKRAINFAAPVYEAFGMNRAEAKAHSEADLLLTLGCDVALTYCR